MIVRRLSEPSCWKGNEPHGIWKTPGFFVFVSLELCGLLSLLLFASLFHSPCWGRFLLQGSQFLLPRFSWLWITVVLILAKLYFCILEPDWSLIQRQSVWEAQQGSGAPFCSVSCVRRQGFCNSSGHLGSPLWKEEGTTSKAWAGQQSPKQVYLRVCFY